MKNYNYLFMRSTTFIVITVLFSFHAAVNSAEENGTEFEFAARLLEDGMYRLAAEQYREFAIAHPEDPKAEDALFLVGEALFKGTFYRDALEAYENFVLSKPSSDRVLHAWFAIGECHRLAEDSKSALQAYRQVIRIDPKSTAGRNALLQTIEIQTNLGLTTDAIQSCQTFEDSFPDDPELPSVRYRHAGLLVEVEDYSGARGRYDSYLKSLKKQKEPDGYGTHDEILYMRAVCLEKSGELKHALKEFKHVLERFRDTDFGRRAAFHVGELHMMMGKPGDALADFSLFLTRYPESPRAHNARWNKAEIYLTQGDTLRTMDSLRDLIERSPGQNIEFSALLKLADLLIATENIADAIANLERIVHTDEGEEYSLGAIRRIADLCIVQKDFRSAASYYRRFIESFPDHPDTPSVAFRFALLSLIHLDKPHESVELLEKLIASHSQHREIDRFSCALGLAIEASRRPDEAIDYYTGFIERYPASSFVDMAQSRIEYLRTYEYVDEAKALYRAIELLEHARTMDASPEWLADTGMFFYGDVKNYTKSLGYFTAFLERYPEHRRSRELIYYAGESCRFLGQQAKMIDWKRAVLSVENEYILSGDRLPGESSLPVSEFDDSVHGDFPDTTAPSHPSPANEVRSDEEIRAERYFHSLLKGSVADRWAAMAEWRILEMRTHHGGDSLDAKTTIAGYSDYLSRFPDSPFADRACCKIGKEYLKQAKNGDISHISQAVLFFQKCIEKSSDRFRIRRATFQMGESYCLAGDRAKALRLFEKCAKSSESDPLVPPSMLKTAECLYHMGRYEETITVAKTFQKDYFYSPAMPRVHTLLVRAYKKNRDYIDARELLKRLKTANGGAAWTDSLSYECALLHFQSRRAGDAIEELEYLLGRFPLSPLRTAVYDTLITAMIERNRLDYANELIERAESEYISTERVGDSEGVSLEDLADTNRNNTPVRMNRLWFMERRADLMTAGKEYGKARKTYAHIMEERGITPELQGKIASSYFQEKNLSEGNKQLALFRESFPEEVNLSSELYLQKALLHLELGDEDSTTHILNRLIDTYPLTRGAGKALYHGGIIALNNQRYASALDLFQCLVAQYPASPLRGDAIFKMGSAYFLMKEFARSASAYGSYLGVFPNSDLSERALFNKAIAEEKGKQWSAAQASLERFLKEYPASEFADEVRFKLAYIHNESGNYRKAVELFTALQYTGERAFRAEIQYWLGEAYFNLENYTKAVTEFLKVPYLYGDIPMWAPTAEFRAAQTYVKTGDLRQAKRLFSKIIEEQGALSSWGEASGREIDKIDELLREDEEGHAHITG
jgi:TolA-binding protein